MSTVLSPSPTCAHTAPLLVVRSTVRRTVVFVALAVLLVGAGLVVTGLGTGPGVVSYGRTLGGLMLAGSGAALLLARASAASSR